MLVVAALNPQVPLRVAAVNWGAAPACARSGPPHGVNPDAPAAISTALKSWSFLSIGFPALELANPDEGLFDDAGDRIYRTDIHKTQLGASAYDFELELRTAG
jgi:hypothetical protein